MFKIFKHYKGGDYRYFGDALGMDEPADYHRFFREARLESDGRNGPLYRVYVDFDREFWVAGLNDSVRRSLYQSVETGLNWLRPVEEFQEKFTEVIE